MAFSWTCHPKINEESPHIRIPRMKSYFAVALKLLNQILIRIRTLNPSEFHSPRMRTERNFKNTR